MCKDFVNQKWMEQIPEFWTSIEDEAEEQYQAAMKKWKEGREVAEGTAESYHQALESFDQVGIPLADALSEQLGMHVVIMAVGPVGSQKGEVQLRTCVITLEDRERILTYLSGFSPTCLTDRRRRIGASLIGPGSLRWRLRSCATVEHSSQRSSVEAQAWSARAGPGAVNLDRLIAIDSNANVGPMGSTPTPVPAGDTAPAQLGPVPVTAGQGGAGTASGTVEVGEAAAGGGRGGEGGQGGDGDGGDGASGGGRGLAVSIPPATTLPPSEPSSPVDNIDRWSWCATLVKLHKLMSRKDWGPRWRQLAEALVDWMKEHHTGEDFDVSEEFRDEMLEWWRDIGPGDRSKPRLEELPDNVEWLLQENPKRAYVDWERLRVAGDNGVMLVVLGLTWWGQHIINGTVGDGLGAGEAALRDDKRWQYMVDDVLWALGEMTDEMELATRKEWEEEKAAGKAAGKPKKAAAKKGKEKGEGVKAKGGKGKSGKGGTKEGRGAGKKTPTARKGKRGRQDEEEEPEDAACAKHTRSTGQGQDTSEDAGAGNAEAPGNEPVAVAGHTGLETSAPPLPVQKTSPGVGTPAGDAEMTDGANVSAEAARASGSGTSTGGIDEDQFAPQLEDPFEDDPLVGLSAEERRDLEAELEKDPDAEDGSEDDDE
ncbi:hypothetical protein FB451DRAFT_1171778 [Mycena latifolia]|nr:hypothetical protein FB451DRAFT_1171778 [Mycena latifolia]